MKNEISRRLWLQGTAALSTGALLAQSPLFTGSALASEGSELESTGYRYQITTTGDVFAGEEGQEKEVGFKVSTDLSYREKVLKQEENRLGLRRYENAKTTMKFGIQDPRIATLPEKCQDILVIADEDEASEIEFRCTSKEFTAEHQDLLRTPFNTLFFKPMANSLFGSNKTLKAGHAVELSKAIAGGLFGLGKVEKTSLKLKVDKANAVQAIVKLSGEIEGQYLDSPTKITASGSMRVLFGNQSITQVRATFEEKREKGMIGPKFQGKTKLKLDPAKELPELASEFKHQLLKVAQQEPSLKFQSRKNPLAVRHAANWKVVYDRPGAVVWRWIADGEPIGQCSLVIPSTKAVRKIELKNYAEGVTSALKGASPKLVSKKRIKKKDRDILEVVVKGRESGISVQWSHYLVSFHDGRRAEVVLTSEKVFAEFSQGQGQRIAESLNLKAQKMADLAKPVNR